MSYYATFCDSVGDAITNKSTFSLVWKRTLRSNLKINFLADWKKDKIDVTAIRMGPGTKIPESHWGSIAVSRVRRGPYGRHGWESEE